MMMKYPFYITCLFVFVNIGRVSAQNFHMAYSNTPGNQLVLTGLQGKVLVEGYEGGEITATYKPFNENMPASAKDLKAVYTRGTDNTGLGLLTEQTGNGISFKNLLPERQQGTYTFKVPNKLLLHYNSGEQGRRYAAMEGLTVTGMQNDIEVKNDNGAVILRGVSGSIVVSSNNGKVDITPDKLDKTKPISIITVHSDITLNLPAGAAADLQAGTSSGQVYSNVTLAPEPHGKKNSATLQGKMGGGGTDIHLQSLDGNIYIRQK